LPSGFGQIDTPKLAGHFTRDELSEDCIDELEVDAIRAYTLLGKSIGPSLTHCCGCISWLPRQRGPHHARHWR